MLWGWVAKGGGTTVNATYTQTYNESNHNQTNNLFQLLGPKNGTRMQCEQFLLLETLGSSLSNQESWESFQEKQKHWLKYSMIFILRSREEVCMLRILKNNNAMRGSSMSICESWERERFQDKQKHWLKLIVEFSDWETERRSVHVENFVYFVNMICVLICSIRLIHGFQKWCECTLMSIEGIFCIPYTAHLNSLQMTAHAPITKHSILFLKLVSRTNSLHQRRHLVRSGPKLFFLKVVS